MRSFGVSTYATDLSSSFPVHTLGAVGGFDLRSEWPGGCLTASFNLSVTATFSHPSLTPGRPIRIFDQGLPVWYGVLTDPEVDAPWTINAAGASSLANGYACLDANGLLTWDPNVAVAQAIVRGLQWSATVPTVLPSPFVAVVAVQTASLAGATTLKVTLTSGPVPAPNQTLAIGTDLVTVTASVLAAGVYTLTLGVGLVSAHSVAEVGRVQPSESPGQVSDLLNTVAAAQGQRWGVDAFGVMSMAADSTTPVWYLIAGDKPGSRTIDNYVTDIYATYLSNATGQLRTFSLTASALRSFGRVEQQVDLTPLGAMSAANALSLVQGMITNASARAFFTGAITVQPGALTTIGGIAVPLTVPKPNDCVRFLNVQPDPQFGEPTYTNVVQVPLGVVDYDGDSDTLQIAPTNHDLRDLTSVLAVAAA